MTASAPVTTAFGAAYLDFDEVWGYLQMDAAPTGQNAIRLQRFIDSACTQAQGPSGANRPIAPTQLQERHDGWSGDTIQLYYSPFLALVSCVENMSTGGPISLPESTPEHNGFDGVAIDYGTSQVTRTFAGGWPRPYFPGLRNIEVTYVAGFNPLPPDLWEATMELVAWKWRNSQEAPRWFGRNDEYTGPMRQPSTVDWAAVFESYRLPTIG